MKEKGVGIYDLVEKMNEEEKRMRERIKGKKVELIKKVDNMKRRDEGKIREEIMRMIEMKKMKEMEDIMKREKEIRGIVEDMEEKRMKLKERRVKKLE